MKEIVKIAEEIAGQLGKNVSDLTDEDREKIKQKIKSTKDKSAKESYRRRLADSGEYTKKQIEQIKESILDLKEDIIRIKQG
jgi:gas vesicle protein